MHSRTERGNEKAIKSVGNEKRPNTKHEIQ